MTGPAPNDGMQLTPEKLADLADAYARSAEAVHVLIGELTQQATFPGAWARDPVSVEAAAHYKLQAIEGSASTIWALSRWQEELASIRDTLRLMHAAYNANESDVITSLRRR